MGVHSMYLISGGGIFDICPVRMSRQPQSWRRGQKHGVSLSGKRYHISPIVGGDILHESKSYSVEKKKNKKKMYEAEN